MSRTRHLHLHIVSGPVLLAALLASAAGCLTKPVNSRAIRTDGGRPRVDARVTAADGPTGDGGRFQVDGGSGVGAGDGPQAEPEPQLACERGDQCESGFCVDGVCCNVACSGSCVSCNQPGRVGECFPVPAGQADPRGTCRDEGDHTCGQSGTCNGRGGCALYPPGTICGVASCAGPRTFVPAGECDGAGACVKGAPLECTPYNCEAAACRASCVADADCVPPNVCADGKCGLRGIGQACTASDQCQSSFCVDGVCCESACTGRCQFCASPASRGSCRPVTAGAPDPRAAAGVSDPALVCVDQGTASCGTNGRCDGRGGCSRYENGTICRPARCETGPNAEFGESVCMGGTCRSPAGLSCAPFRGCSGARCRRDCDEDDDDLCASGFVCIDDGCARQVQGGPCEEDEECVSGICAQGRCCNMECDSACRSCNLEGSRGICTARTFSEELDVDDDNVLTGEPVFLNDGDDVPPGQYTITYLHGCNKYSPLDGWTVNATDENGCCGWWLIGGSTADKKLLMPGHIGTGLGVGSFADFNACNAASRMSPAKTYTHPGGPLGVFLQDSLYTDNVQGENDDNPTWRVTGTLTCPP